MKVYAATVDPAAERAALLAKLRTGPLAHGSHLDSRCRRLKIEGLVELIYDDRGELVWRLLDDFDWDARLASARANLVLSGQQRRFFEALATVPRGTFVSIATLSLAVTGDEDWDRQRLTRLREVVGAKLRRAGFDIETGRKLGYALVRRKTWP